MELAIAIAANVVIGLVLLALFAFHRVPDSLRLAGPQEALAIYHRQFPDAVGSATVAADGNTALISLQQEAGIGLIHRQGRRWNARELLPEDLRSVIVDGDTITLSIADFGWPRSQVRITDPGTRTSWLSRLSSLASQRPESIVTPHA